MMTTTLLIFGGLLLLFIGGEILVRGAVALAKFFNISILVIGLTVVAFATSAPELFINIQAAWQDYADVAIGNVVGSNMSNTLLVLGLTAMICPVVAKDKGILIDVLILMIIAVIVHLFCWTSYTLSFIEGAILFAIIISYSIFRIYYERTLNSKTPSEALKEIEDEVEHVKPMPLWQSISYLVAGVLMLKFGADYFVDGSVTFAGMFGISEAVIGLTLVAIGSSAPELAISVIAAFRKHSDIVIGNIIGSNIFNFASILGITALLKPVPVSPSFVQSDLFILFAFTAILLAIIYFYGSISRKIGAVFFASYSVYVLSLLLY